MGQIPSRPVHLLDVSPVPPIYDLLSPVFRTLELVPILMSETPRDVMEYEVAIVGAGPAGLACAIRLKQLKPDMTICVLEKAATLGAHSLSGAVLEPGPLNELLPQWRDHAPQICVAAARDEFFMLTRRKRYKLPLPPQMLNHGNFIISLGQL